MRKHYFLFSLVVLSFSFSLPQTLRGQAPPCMSNSNISPSTYVPFTSIYYISAPDRAGDLMVVGANFAGSSGVPLPNATNQQFCNPITLAPGIVANAYVPTAVERTGDFSAFSGLLFDPTCTGDCPAYYGGGIIPADEIPTVFAWRIPPTQPGPPVYVSTGYGAGMTTGQVLAVDGSSGVTSVLFTSPTTQYYDFEGLAVGPDNLIYVTCPDDATIFRIDQSGGSLETVYTKMSGSSGPYEPQGPSFSSAGVLTFNTADFEGVWQISFDSSDNPSAPTMIIPPPGDLWGGGTAFNLAEELLIAEQPWGATGPSEVLQQTSPGAATASPLITLDLFVPIGIAVNSSGNIFVANLNNYLYSNYSNGGYITQFDSTGNPVGSYEGSTPPNTYVAFNYPDTPTFIQFDASGRLYVVTVQQEYDYYGKVWRVDPCAIPPCTPTLLIDLGYAFSNGTVPNLNGSSAMGVALPGTGTTNSYTTPPLPITPGTPVTYTYGNITNQTIAIPIGSNLGGAASIAVNFQQWNPTVFDTTRIPATSTNSWSGGTPVPNGTTCTPIAGTGDNCIVIEELCYAANGNPILPCQIFAPLGSAIVLTSTYQTQAPQPYPGLIIADDGLNNWANITYSSDVTGHTNGLNTDTAIVNINLSGTAPKVSFTGAPLSAGYQSSFGVTATTVASTTAVITATAGSVCSVAGTEVTMTSGTGTCYLTAYWPADTTYAAAYATQSIGATKISPSVSFTGAPSSAPYNSTFPVTATTNASTTASISASGACSIMGDTVAMISGTGTCYLTANWASDNNYKAASANQATAAVPATQTIDVTTPAPGLAAYGTAFPVAATASSGLAVAITTSGVCSGSGSGSATVTMTNSTGTCTVNFNQAGNTNYSAAPTVTSFTTATGALASISPPSINFGTVYLGAITVRSVMVSNVGTQPMTISNPFFSILPGGDPSEFVAVNLCPKSLAAGKSCAIEVSFIAGPFYTPQTAMLSIVDNAPGSPQTVAISATVINPQAWLSATSLSFGTVNVGQSSAAKAVTLKNAGATPLSINSITIPGANSGEFVETNTCLTSGPPASLAPTASCTINVTFKPTAKGSRTASVVITDNAQNSPQTLWLSGTGK